MMPHEPETHVPASSTISQEKRDWETALTPLSKFLRLTPENRDVFFGLLDNESDQDTYLTSSVYYALTGRKGLWTYQDENSYVPLCWHRNVEGQILIFPPRGNENSRILSRLLAEIPVPPMGIRLARIKKDGDQPSWLSNVSDTFERSVLLVPVAETILDWLYPVRVLSSELVSKLQGQDFRRIRNCVRRAEDQKISIERLTSDSRDPAINFAYRWANRRTANVDDLMELWEPYRQILTLLGDESFKLDGLVFKMKDHIQAVAIWERPNTNDQVANLWVNLSDPSVKGISELMMKSIAETLYSEGVPFLNLGGSETRGLDNYKRKYRPPYSLALHSVEAVVDSKDSSFNSPVELEKTRIAG